MSSDFNFTKEEAIIIAEVQEILQNISNALNRFPPHVRQHLLSNIKTFDQESQSLNDLLDS
jgi:altronate dehydratase